DKLNRCLELGAETAINTRERPLSSVEATYDAVVDFTGATDLIESALSRLGTGGRLVNLTTFPGRTLDVSPRAQVLGETEVVGSRYCSTHEYLRCGELVASGEIEPVVSEVVDLEGVPELLDRIAAGSVTGRGAVVL
ncbi:MAG: zinc-binding dehydrogenase, partial [Natronomonas sp.]|nr:zinc-binding dehydrogenase [Natronomonas sp.]